MSDQQPRRPAVRLKVIGPVILIAIGFCLWIALFPTFSHSMTASNHRMALTSLKTIASAEEDFKANDRDWNHVNDYWTGDVKSLYTLTSAALTGVQDPAKDPSMKLIEVSVALSDADPTLVPAAGENPPVTQYGVPASKGGYWLAAMLRDEPRDPKLGDPVYRQDTGGVPTMGRCHHEHRFGFVAFPAAMRTSGWMVYIVDQGWTVRGLDLYQQEAGKEIKTPPGLDKIPPEYLNWPSEGELKKNWKDQ